MLKQLDEKTPKNWGSHSVMVTLPLAVVTVFCFSYIAINSNQTLKNNETSAASKKPLLFTGKPLPKAAAPDLAPQAEAQPITSEGTSLPVSSPSATQPATGTPSTGYTPQTSNPQNASKGPVTNSISDSNKTSSLPSLKVDTHHTIINLLNKF